MSSRIKLRDGSALFHCILHQEQPMFLCRFSPFFMMLFLYSSYIRPICVLYKTYIKPLQSIVFTWLGRGQFSGTDTGTEREVEGDKSLLRMCGDTAQCLCGLLMCSEGGEAEIAFSRRTKADARCCHHFTFVK